MKHNQQRRYWCIVLFVIAGLLLAACANKQKTYTIGVINLVPALDPVIEGFKEGMTELGYIEGESITYIYEGATGRIETLDSVAQSLVEADVDLMLSVSTPATQAAQRATVGSRIAVVFVPLTDPVGAGIVDSLREPGGNITGITFGAQEARRLAWLLQIVPTIKEIYVPYNPEDRSAVLSLETVREAATTLGVALIPRKIHDLEEITAAIENAPEEADAVFFPPDSLVGSHAPEFLTLQLPTSLADPTNMAAFGMLSSFGIEFTAAGRQAARLADQIFQGVKPSDLPVETAEFYLAINLRAAEALGLDISDEVLRQADIVIR
jgi:putative ABC transport system substrate-binding protein